MTTPVLSRAETQVNTTDVLFQGDSHLVGLADGGYVIVWTDISGTSNPDGSITVVAQRFDSNGGRVGGEVGAPRFGAWMDWYRDAPAITYLPSSGMVAVASVQYDEGFAPGPPTFQGIEVAYYDPGLGAWAFGGRVGINNNDEVFLSDPSITAFDDGNAAYAISYTFHEELTPTTPERSWIVGQVVHTNGTRTQFDIHHEDDLAGRSELATLSNGNFVAVFEDQFDGGATDVRYRIFTPNGTAATPSTIVSGAGDSVSEYTPYVAALHGGGFVVIWSDPAGDADGQGVRATILDNAGNPVHADFPVNTSTAGAQAAADVVALADGGFLVTWQDGGAGALRAQRFDALGNAMGAEFTVRTPSGGASDAALLQDGRFAYATDDVSSGDPDVVTSIWNPRGNMGALGDVLWRHDGGSAATGLHDLGIVPNTWQIQGSGDFDADGDADILWRHDDGLVVTWEMQNGQYLTNHNVAFASTGWDIAGTGDFDADGDADILWRHQDGAVVAWEMDNGQYVTNHNIAFASIGWRIEGLGDFDADGDSDVIWRHQDGAVVTWEMENNQYVTNHNIAFASTGWRIQGTGNFDGDGDADILWRHNDGMVVTWEMQGGNYVANHNLPIVPTTWQIRGAEDFDSDGDSDILWRHDDGQVVTWEMQGGNYVANHNIGLVTNDWQIRGTGEFDLV